MIAPHASDRSPDEEARDCCTLAMFCCAIWMISLVQSEPKTLAQVPSSIASFKSLGSRPLNVNEQPANGREEDDDLMVLEVSRKRFWDTCWACGSTTLAGSGTVAMLLSICQFWVELFMSLEPVETTAGIW